MHTYYIQYYNQVQLPERIVIYELTTTEENNFKYSVKVY